MYHMHDFFTSQGRGHKTIPHNERPNYLPTKALNDSMNVQAIERHKGGCSILPPGRESKDRQRKFKAEEGRII